jgi:hypothetical protein
MTDTGSAIAATGQRRSFGDHLVLDGVDLDVADDPDAVRAAIGVTGRSPPSTTCSPAPRT